MTLRTILASALMLATTLAWSGESTTGPIIRNLVKDIEVVLDKDNEEAVNGLHTCVLRLRLHRASDVLIMARGSDFSGVLKRAFRLARYELIRRPRKRRPMFARTQPALS